MCESDEESYATEAFADEAMSSRLLFGSCLCILAASMAPLADALLDLWRHFIGLTSEKSPYTWHIDSTASAVYLAERLSVLLVYDVTAILALVVTSPGSNYDPAVIYNVLHGGAFASFALTGGIFLSILRLTTENVVTDIVALWLFVVRFANGLVYYWGCSPVARLGAIAVEVISIVYLFGIVFKDCFVDDDGGESMDKSYRRAVSLTYATFYFAYISAQVISFAILREESFLRYPVTRLIAAVYISMTCTYLASPKWREELLQSVRMRKNMQDIADSQRFHAALERRSKTLVAKTMATGSARSSTSGEASESQTRDGGGGGGGGFTQTKPKPQPILHNTSRTTSPSSIVAN